MAIDPKLLVLKPVSELETVKNPTTGSLLFYDGGDKLKKTNVSDFYNAIVTRGSLKISDTAPTAQGLYILSSAVYECCRWRFKHKIK